MIDEIMQHLTNLLHQNGYDVEMECINTFISDNPHEIEGTTA
jgi:hypothetical protein